MSYFSFKKGNLLKSRQSMKYAAFATTGLFLFDLIASYFLGIQIDMRVIASTVLTDLLIASLF